MKYATGRGGGGDVAGGCVGGEGWTLVSVLVVFERMAVVALAVVLRRWKFCFSRVWCGKLTGNKNLDTGKCWLLRRLLFSGGGGGGNGGDRLLQNFIYLLRVRNREGGFVTLSPSLSLTLSSTHTRNTYENQGLCPGEG